jgi:excisionase family DNA binding protein
MASVADIRREPRYGSAADVASYAGVSVKTVRRLVDAGAVRGLKIGRRLVIPFQDLDDHILRTERDRRPTAMPATLPQSTFDARGRALPLSPEEARRRSEEALRALADVEAMGDEEEQRATFAALAQAIDEDRLSDRARFGG